MNDFNIDDYEKVPDTSEDLGDCTNCAFLHRTEMCYYGECLPEENNGVQMIYKLKEKPMDKLDQLKKDYEKLGETIAAMEAKTVWSEYDIVHETKVETTRYEDALKIIANNFSPTETFLLQHRYGYFLPSTPLSRKEMATYLNENAYTKLDQSSNKD